MTKTYVDTKDDKVLKGTLKGNHSYYEKDKNYLIPQLGHRSFNKEFVLKLLDELINVVKKPLTIN